jgi:hypothetical protein
MFKEEKGILSNVAEIHSRNSKNRKPILSKTQIIPLLYRGDENLRPLHTNDRIGDFNPTEKNL